MKRLLASAFALALLGAAAPAFAQQYDRHYDRHYARGYYAQRDAHYYAWQRMHHRYRYWHGRPVTYYNGVWGYWAPSNGVHVFIRVPL